VLAEHPFDVLLDLGGGACVGLGPTRETTSSSV
jgi:hypothetical protein